MDILGKLKDLIIQATHERSHFYVKSVCIEAGVEIEKLREENKMLIDKIKTKHLCNSCSLAVSDSCNHSEGYTVVYSGSAENVIACKHYDGENNE